MIGNKRSAKANMIHISFERIFKSITGISTTKEVIPKTANTLNIFDPIKFPIASVSSFRIAAMIEAANSGILVPIATRLSDIILSVTPHSLAILTELSTNKSAPKYRAIAPASKSEIDFHKGNETTSCNKGASCAACGLSFLILIIKKPKANKEITNKLYPKVMALKK